MSVVELIKTWEGKAREARVFGNFAESDQWQERAQELRKALWEDTSLIKALDAAEYIDIQLEESLG